MSQSSGALYRCATIAGSLLVFASSSHIENKSPSVAACVLIAISSGSSYAPWEVSIASMNGSWSPRTCPTSSRMARIGLSPCAVPASALTAWNSTLRAMPIIFLPLGMIRHRLSSSGFRWIIFTARLNTSAAWSRDRAPEIICELSTASGPMMCASSIAAIKAVFPFFRAMDRYARRTPLFAV